VDVSEIEGWTIDLGISSTEECRRYGWHCWYPGEESIISVTTIGDCDGDGKCKHDDFQEDTCLMPVE